jgi:UDP-GlcNAc:undecaprenyl-phosphate/decaprenyl-phosphate GlcNAc-1-phosphate transferase
MDGRIASLLLPQTAAFLFALAVVPLVRRLARRCGVMAVPGPESRHAQPTAMLGGVAIVGALLGALALADNLPPWLLLATVVLTAVGLVDDVCALRPAQKLAAQIAVTLAVIWFGPRFALSHHAALDALLAFLWLVGTTNAFNLIDGLDGLAEGIGIVATLAVAVTAALYNNMALAGWAMALSGALCGFLVYNFHPA